MLKIFNSNILVQLLIIVAVTMVLWMEAMVTGAAMQPSYYYSPLYDVVYGMLYSMPRVAVVVGMVCVVAQGAWFNITLSDFKLSGTNSLLPMLLYIVAMSWNRNALTITPMVLAMFPILVACRQLLSHGATQLPVSKNFNAAFLVGIAAMCHLPMVGFVLPMLIVFILYKMYNWRDIAVSLLGLAAPYVALLTYAFLHDKLEYSCILMLHDLTTISTRVEHIATLPTVTNIIFVVVTLVALLGMVAGARDNMVHQRINNAVLCLPLLVAFGALFNGVLFPPDTQALAIPFAFMTSQWLNTERRRNWINEVALWIILISATV